MAYNQNFYNNFHGGNFTFQNQFPNPLPTPPPPPVTPFCLTPHLSDQEFIKKFERHINITKEDTDSKPKDVNIQHLKKKLSKLILNLRDIQDKHKELSANIDKYIEAEWNSLMYTISNKKKDISNTIVQFNGSYMELARIYLAKRTAKRLRLKKMRGEKRKQKTEKVKKNEEQSRKIDENLQKIKDDILRANKEEEAKLEADMVLKDVLRKKADAKKCLAKLDALLKLRQARQNTAKGRGQYFSENEAALFQKNIDKLTALWMQRLEMYDKEECNLRSQLTKATFSKSLDDLVKVEGNLKAWKQVLFGGVDPQANFNEDPEKFIAVRSQWDQYINDEGTSLPIGWVVNI